MNRIKKSIIATIAYANTKDWPLSSWEIYRYLINPSRINNKRNKLSISFRPIQKSLNELVRENIIKEKNGFYSLISMNSVDTRITRDIISDLKNKKVLKKLYFLSFFPFVRGVFLSGSLAFGWVRKKSDIDVLIVAKDKRLWTARLVISLILLLLGLKRTKNKIKNKICLNHFISEKKLKIPLYSLYNAETYTRLIPIHVKKGIVKNFIKKNNWVSNYLTHGFGSYYCDSRTKNYSIILKLMQVFLESIIFVIGCGSILEKVLKRLQTRRIKKDPLTYEKGGRIVFNDNQIELHPESPERNMINQYNKTLKELNLFRFKIERDSGLRR